jgi:hypothetical protein
MQSAPHGLRRARQWIHTADRRIVAQVKARSMLVTASAVLLCVAWAIAGGHSWFVACLVIVGASSYFLGLLPSFAVTAACWSILALHEPRVSLMSTLLIEIMGLLWVSWLGYHHRVQERALEQSEPRHDPSHRPQLIPWAVANDIRTSLAAVRFLLFPGKDDSLPERLRQASNELSRLEALFQELENATPDESSSQKASATDGSNPPAV